MLRNSNADVRAFANVAQFAILGLADIRIMPRHDMIVLVVTNSGDEAANQVIPAIGKRLKDRLKPFD